MRDPVLRGSTQLHEVTFADVLDRGRELRLAVFDWLGLVIGVVGIFLAVLFWLRPPGPKPACQFYSLPILEADNPLTREGISILYDDRPVSRLTKTYISFWNAGLTTLDGEAIVSDDPIRWSFEEGSEVLRVRPLKRYEANKFVATEDPHRPNSVICSFNYLNRRQGALFEVLHTSSKGTPRVSGSIKGANRIRSSRYGLLSSIRSRPLKPKNLATSVEHLQLRSTRFSAAVIAASFIIRIGIIAVLVLLSTRTTLQWEEALCNPPSPNQTLEACRADAQTGPLWIRVITLAASALLIFSMWRSARGAPADLSLRNVLEPAER